MALESHLQGGGGVGGRWEKKVAFVHAGWAIRVKEIIMPHGASLLLHSCKQS